MAGCHLTAPIIMLAALDVEVWYVLCSLCSSEDQSYGTSIAAVAAYRNEYCTAYWQS